MIPKTLSQFRDEIYKSIGPVDKAKGVGNLALKAQMFEVNNLKEFPQLDGHTPWKSFDDTKHWYISSRDKEYYVMNRVNERIWVLYSLSKVKAFKKVVNTMLSKTLGLDNCWISGKQMEKVGQDANWSKKGVGYRYKDSLSAVNFASDFSIKAWYGGNEHIDRALGEFDKAFPMSSVRWKDHEGLTSSEWYSDGRVTFHSVNDISDAIRTISEASMVYFDSLTYATKIRDEEKGSFELSFEMNVNLDGYVEAAKKGKGNLKLWMTEVESHDDFKRLRGVDLHTWDRILLDLANDYAYMTIPGNGCVNAAPRLANVQGVTVFGKAGIFYNGNEIFV